MRPLSALERVILTDDLAVACALLHWEHYTWLEMFQEYCIEEKWRVMIAPTQLPRIEASLSAASAENAPSAPQQETNDE